MAIEIVEQTSRLWPIQSIVIKDRKRPLGDISVLAESINKLGLLNPITILPDSTLIAGYHRLEACKLLGWRSIPVNIVILDHLNAELAEIDENLIRNELHWFDRDKHLTRRKEIYEALHPETKHGGDRKSEETKSNGNNFHLIDIPSFAEDTATKTGVTDRTIRNSIQRAQAFTEDQGEVLKQAHINPTDATKIARLPKTQRTAVIQTLADGKAKSYRDAKAIVKQDELREAFHSACVDLDTYHVHHCSVADFSQYVQANSIDAIITDPPYPREYLSVYSDLAQFAAYALKPGGSLVVMVGQSYLPEIMRMLCEYLTYHWVGCYFHPGPETRIWQRQVICGWKPLLWFTKGESNIWIKDIFKSHESDKEHHEWGQSESGIAHIIEQFTLPEQVICDPFVGGGTTAVVAARMKRSFVGCDIDQPCVETTKLRLYEVLS